MELARIVEQFTDALYIVHTVHPVRMFEELFKVASRTHLLFQDIKYGSVHSGNWVKRGIRAHGQISQREQIGVS